MPQCRSAAVPLAAHLRFVGEAVPFENGAIDDAVTTLRLLDEERRVVHEVRDLRDKLDVG